MGLREKVGKVFTKITNIGVGVTVYGKLYYVGMRAPSYTHT
jgi:hypothetical protein